MQRYSKSRFWLLNSKVGSAANFPVCWENAPFTESNCVKVADTDSGKVDARIHISHLTNLKCNSFLNNVGFFELKKAYHSSFYCLGKISKVILYCCAEELNEVIQIFELVVVLFNFRSVRPN